MLLAYYFPDLERFSKERLRQRLNRKLDNGFSLNPVFGSAVIRLHE